MYVFHAVGYLPYSAFILANYQPVLQTAGVFLTPWLRF